MDDSSHSPSPDISPNPSNPSSNSNPPVVTIFADSPNGEEEEEEEEEEEDYLLPEAKRTRFSPLPSAAGGSGSLNHNFNNHVLEATTGNPMTSAGMAVAAAAAANSAALGNCLSNHEEKAVRQLITGELASPSGPRSQPEKSSIVEFTTPEIAKWVAKVLLVFFLRGGFFPSQQGVLGHSKLEQGVL